MRYACAQLAAAGFAVVAPALLDRAERGVDLGYSAEDLQRGIALRARVNAKDTVADIEAARAIFGGRKVGVIGYCWGGRVAWWGATRSDRFAASVAWYGGGIAADKDVEAIRAAQPDVEIFVYEGVGHGFGCEERPMFDMEAYSLAQARTVEFFRAHLA
jgi:carboxymethylenebutenolidase